jgi:ketosteroid isomerase-like protein
MTTVVLRSTRRKTLNLTEEKERLLKRDAEWARLAAEGRDIEGMLSYWSEDAIVIPPGLPAVAGKAALRQYVESSMKLPGFSISWTSTDVTFSPDGTLAYMMSTNEVKLNAPDGSLTTTAGRAITIWRRESDDEWRCVVEIWNAGPSSA